MPIALILRVVTLENQQIRSKACGHSPCICTPPGASILRHGQHKFHSYHQRLCSWVLMAQQKDCSINSQGAIEEKGQPPLHSSSQRKKEPRWILDLSYLASDSAFLQLQTQRKHFYYTTPWRLETHKRELRTSKGISGGSRPKNVSKKRTDEMKARHGCYRRRRATANGDGRRPAAAAPLVGMGISIGEDTRGVHPSRAPQAAAASAAADAASSTRRQHRHQNSAASSAPASPSSVSGHSTSASRSSSVASSPTPAETAEDAPERKKPSVSDDRSDSDHCALDVKLEIDEAGGGPLKGSHEESTASASCSCSAGRVAGSSR